MGIGVFVAHLFLPPLLLAWHQQQMARQGLAAQEGPASPELSLLGRYQSLMIVRLSLLEGGAFMAAIAYFVEGHLLSLLLAGGLIAAMVFHFPTAGRVARWLERHGR
jgi:hypothetical protein